jgi:voltage-gated potassium channel
MASVIMLTGFAIIAVPTGIVTSEIGREMQPRARGAACSECGWDDHDARAPPLPAMRCGAAVTRFRLLALSWLERTSFE